MKIIQPSFEILAISPDNPLQLLELAGRTCYKSEDRMTDESSKKFCGKMLESQHESVITTQAISSFKSTNLHSGTPVQTLKHTSMVLQTNHNPTD